MLVEFIRNAHYNGTTYGPDYSTQIVDVTESAGRAFIQRGVAVRLDAAKPFVREVVASVQVKTDEDAKQALYTVPGGKKFIPTAVVIRNASDDLSTIADVLTFGFNAEAGEVLSGISEVSLASLTDDTSLVIALVGAAANSAVIPIGNAGEIFGCKFLDYAITATVDIDVIGYLIEA